MGLDALAGHLAGGSVNTTPILAEVSEGSVCPLIMIRMCGKLSACSSISLGLEIVDADLFSR